MRSEARRHGEREKRERREREEREKRERREKRAWSLACKSKALP